MLRTPTRSDAFSTMPSPLSANKAALLHFDGGEQPNEEEEEKREEKEEEVLESMLPMVKSFVTTALARGFGEDELKVFAHVMEENSGPNPTSTLRRMIEADESGGSKGAWMKEFLNISLKAPSQRTKVTSSFSKISAAFEAMSFDLCCLLGQLEEANLASETFPDFDFSNLVPLLKEVDGPTTKASEGILRRKIMLTDLIIAISEGAFLAGAHYILCHIVYHPPPAPSSIAAIPEAIFEKKINDTFAQMNSRIEEASDLQRRLSESVIQSLNLVQEDNREFKARLASMMEHMGRLDVIVEPTIDPARQSANKRFSGQLKAEAKSYVPFGGFLGAGNRSNPGSKANASTGQGQVPSSCIESSLLESPHEKRAVDLGTSEALQRLTSTSKGNAVTEHDNFNLGYRRGLPPTASGSANARFGVSPNAVVELVKTGLLVIPGLGLVTHSSNSKMGAKDKFGRNIYTNPEEASHWVRELAHIAPWDSHSPNKDFVSLINVAFNLPKSLAHLSRFLTEQLDFLKNGVLHSIGPFEDEGMLELIESCLSKFLSNMCEASAQLLDGVKTPCMSIDGHWRGLLQLFWFQYSRSFSTFRQDSHSVFYPQALNQGFEDNRDILFRDYNWSTQLTCELANTMRYQCWKCSSDVLHQSCLSAECKKKRSDEEAVNVYIGKGAPGPSGAKAISCRMSKG